jgi:hypothetical protein
MKGFKGFLLGIVSVCLLLSLIGCIPIISILHFITESKSTISTSSTSSSNSVTSYPEITSSTVTSSSNQSSQSSSKPKISSAVSSKPKVIYTYSKPNTGLEYYGYTLLSGDDRISYNQIAQVIDNCDPKVTFNPQIRDKATFDKIFNYYIADHPEAIQLGKDNFLISTADSRIESVDFSKAYLFNKAEKDRRIAAINAKLPKILGNIPANASDFDVELKIHDWLVNNCRYDATAPNCYDAYGAIVDGRAVCQGYAYAMQYLLYRAGIQCLFVSGTSQDQPHGWNIVKIDRYYYQLDVTWDDPVSNVSTLSHQYFNLTYDEMNVDHLFDTTNYPLPDCSSTADNYFVEKKLVLNTIGDADTILKNAMLNAAMIKSTEQIEVRINPDQYSGIYDQLKQSRLQFYLTQIRKYGYNIKGYSYSPKSTEQNQNYVYIFRISLIY